MTKCLKYSLFIYYVYAMLELCSKERRMWYYFMKFPENELLTVVCHLQRRDVSALSVHLCYITLQSVLRVL